MTAEARAIAWEERSEAEPTPLAARLAGMDARLLSSGALYWPAAETLVVSDLHLETGSAHARRRVFLPPWDTAATLARLEAAVAATSPRRVVSLGDSFHDRKGAERLPPEFRGRLEGLARGREWIWITGNHDHGSARSLPGAVADQIAIDGVVFRHVPSERMTETFEVAGHLHPGARIAGGGGRTVRRRCFAGCARRLVMPAFGVFTGAGGLNVRDPAFRPLWPRLADFTAFMLGRRAVYPIPSEALLPG